jgi:hypothetical protein
MTVKIKYRQTSLLFDVVNIFKFQDNMLLQCPVVASSYEGWTRIWELLYANFLS